MSDLVNRLKPTAKTGFRKASATDTPRASAYRTISRTVACHAPSAGASSGTTRNR